MQNFKSIQISKIRMQKLIEFKKKFNSTQFN